MEYIVEEFVAFAVEAMGSTAAVGTTMAYTAVIATTLAYSASEQRKAESMARDAYNSSLQDRLVNVPAQLAPREMVLGRVRKGGAVFYKGSAGVYNSYFYMAVAFAAHEIDGYDEIYLNDTKVTLDTGGNVATAPWGSTLIQTLTLTTNSSGVGTISNVGDVVDGYGAFTYGVPVEYVIGSAKATYGGPNNSDNTTTAVVTGTGPWTVTTGQPNATVTYQVNGTAALGGSYINSFVKITKYTGAPGQTADPDLMAAFPGDWTSSNTCEGIAYLVIRFAYNDAAFPSGLPNVTAVIRGAKIYDPRKDSTNGGSGSQREFTKSTWAFSENPALMMRHVYAHQNFGKATVSAEENARFVTAANACDVKVDYTETSTNFLTNVSNFSSDNWSKNHTAVVEDARLAPDGSNSADKIVVDLGATDASIYQGVTASPGSTYTYKVWLFAASPDTTPSSLGVKIFLADSLGSTMSSTTLTLNTWVECTVSRTLAAGVTYVNAQIGGAGTLTSGMEIYAWNARLSGTTKTNVETFRAATVAAFGAAPRDVFDQLAQSMGGAWAFAGGEMYVKAGTYTPSVLTLTDNDIATTSRNGASDSENPVKISVHQPRANKFNTVKARISDMHQDYKEVQLTPLKAAALVTRDGTELVQELTYPAISFAPQALHVSGIVLRDSRDSLTVELPVTLRSYKLELFDTVSLNLSRYGWSNKTFTVMSKVWGYGGSLVLTLKSTSAAITTMDSAFTAQGFNPTTLLPSPWEAPSLGTLTVTSGTSELLKQADGTVVSQMKVSWAAPTADALVNSGEIEIQWRLAGTSGSWASRTVSGDSSFFRTTEVQDGQVYTVRARAKTPTAIGDWGITTQHKVVGKTAAPAAITVFTATADSQRVKLEWEFDVVELDTMAVEVWYHSNASGLLANRPSTASVGDAYYATDTGFLYTCTVAPNTWSNVTYGTNHRTATKKLATVPYPATEFLHTGLTAGQGGYYWVRVVDTTGNLSDYFPAATAGRNASLLPAGGNATVYAYKRSATAPTWVDSATSGPGAVTYTFGTGITTPATNALSNGWFRDIPAANGQPLYVTQALASSVTATKSLANTVWSAPVLLSQDGYNGTTVTLYARSATSSQPTFTHADTAHDLTLTFATNTLAAGPGVLPSGWLLADPGSASGGYLWESTLGVSAMTATYVVKGSTWPTPVNTARDGANTATVKLWQRTTTTSAPTFSSASPANDLRYTFATGSLLVAPSGSSFPSGWVSSPPSATLGDYLWSKSIQVASSAAFVDILGNATWGSAVLETQSGWDAAIVTMSAPNPQLPTTTAGVVTYTGSGTTIQVLEAGVARTITACTSSVTVGTVTVGDIAGTGTTTVTVGGVTAHSALSTDAATIKYTLTFTRGDTTSDTVYGYQSLTKSKQGSGAQNQVKGIAFARNAAGSGGAPTGGSFASPTPTTLGWTDGIPADDNTALWMSTRIFTSDGASPQQGAWTAPAKVATPSTGIRSVFSVLGTTPSIGATDATWHVTPVTADVYMATQTSTDNGVTWGAITGSVKIKGEAGTPGVTGTRTAVLDLYQWSDSTPTLFPSGTSTYTWATGQFTNPATMNSWTAVPGAPVLGQTLYIATQVYADTGTSATSSVTWSTSVARPQGAAGINGQRVGFLEVYQWATSAPGLPTGTSTYTWATGAFTAPTTANGWSLTPGAAVAGQTLWATSVRVSDALATATSSVTWTGGSAYAVGGAGSNGTRTAVLDLYQWAASAPVTFPSGTSTYTWATGQFTNPATLNSWTAVPGAPVLGSNLYIARQIYTDTGTSATSSVTWSVSSALSLGAAGSNGQRIGFLEVYQWAASAPSLPTGTSTYTWATGAFTAPTTANGWSLTPGAAVVGQTLWATSVRVSDALTTATSSVTWTGGSAYAVGGAGTNGAPGTKYGVMTLYKWVSGTTAPSTSFPSGSSTCTWGTPNTFSNPATLNSWAQVAPASPGDGYTLWAIDLAFSDVVAAASTGPTSWPASPTPYARGGAGSAGTPATNSATVYIYIRTATSSAPAFSGASPTNDLTYTFSGGAWTGTPASSWGLTAATAGTGAYLWRKSMTASGTGASATVTYAQCLAATSTLMAQDGLTGASARIMYAKGTTSNTFTGTDTTTGGSSFPDTAAHFGVSGLTWQASPPPLTANGDVLYQSDGIYTTGGNTVWQTPYMSNLKVGSLSALQANLGNVTLDTAGSLKTTGINYGGNGVFLGYDTAAYKFSVSNGTNSLTWDGANLAIVGGTVTGGTVRTAASGARVELSSTANDLKVYDSGGVSQIQLGGTNGIALNVNAPAAQNNYPAIRASHAAAYYTIHGINSNSAGYGVYGEATATSGANYGVRGDSASSGGYGVYGKSSSTGYGVYSDGKFHATGAATLASTLTVTGAFGCNGKSAQGSFSVGADATDLTTVIALCNNLRAILVANGIAAL